jgi:hypothetical protein
MNFRDLLEKYQNDTATEEEKRIIEAEIEKSRLIKEYLEIVDENESLDFKFEEETYDEMKQIKNEVRKKKATMIISSVAVVFILLAAFRLILTPVLNSFYYNPNQHTYSDYTVDLGAKLATYTELHFPTIITSGVNFSATGIGSYTFSLYQYDTFKGHSNTISGDIKRSSLTLNEAFWEYPSVNLFSRATYPFGNVPVGEDTLEKLKSLPPYSYLKAYISFDRDISMEEIAQLINETNDSGLYISWVAIRNAEMDIQRLPLIGFEPSGGGPIFDKINEKYPHYEISEFKSASSTVDDSVYENHFRDLIQFQLDHLSFLNMIERNHFNEYYQSVKDYIDQNGIYSYGIVVQGDPKSIIDLTNKVNISDIYVEDIKMILPFTTDDSSGL